jgi:nitrogen fixation/metabolism regulation signal transduction histidine kinase
MVDEFSAFARMPKPQMERHDVREIVREAVFLFQVSQPEIKFELDLPDKPVVVLARRVSPRSLGTYFSSWQTHVGYPLT